MPDDSQTLKLIIQARDEARKSLEQLNRVLAKTERQTQDTAKGFDRAISKTKEFRSGIFGLKSAVAGAVAAFGLWKIARYIKESTLLAGRYKTLGVTLQTIGQQAGYTAREIEEFEENLRKTGIAGREARTILTRMVQGQLDLARSTELARVAQNAAVIANLNSSETLERMLHAIQANSVEILRTIGLNVSFEQSYRKLADQLGVATKDLSESQKLQARFNATIESGSQIAGAYEASMTTAGKQVLSFTRYVSDFRVALGKAFEPTLAVIVKSATQGMKEFTASIKDEAFQKALSDFGEKIGKEVQDGFKWLIENKENILFVIKEIARSLGDAITSLGYVLDALRTTEEDYTRKARQNFARLGQTLTSYVQEQEKLRQKVKEWEESTDFQSRLSKFFDFGKAQRRLRELGVLIPRTQEAMKKLQIQIRGEPGEAARKNFLKSLEDLNNAQTKFTVKTKENAQTIIPALTDTFAAEFARAVAEIELELAKLEQKFDRNLITIAQYYDEREALAEKAFNAEKKYLENEITKAKKTEDRIKAEARLYEAEKKYQIERIKISNDRANAEEEYAKRHQRVQETLARARSQISDISSLQQQFQLEKAALEQQQAERIQTIVEAKLEEKDRIAAIEEAHRLDQIEKDKLNVQQRLAVQQRLTEGYKGILGNLNSAMGDLYEASGRKMKAFFVVQKAISIAQATIATYESAVKAYNSMIGIGGPYAQALATAAASAAIAAGLAKIAVIRTQSYAAGGEIKGYSPHSKADNIKINATAGEFMQPVSAVGKYGLDFMESIRNLSFPASIARKWATSYQPPRISANRSYAEGGVVAEGSNGAGMATNIVVNVEGGAGEDPNELAKNISRVIQVEFDKNLRYQMRPGGLLFRG